MRDRIREAETFEFAKSFRHAEQELAIARRQDDGAGHATAQLTENLIGNGLVAFRPERIAGVEAGEIARGHEAGRVHDAVEGGPALFRRYQQEVAAERRLKMLEGALRVGRGDDNAAQAGAPRVGRRGRAVVSGRCNGDAACAVCHGRGHDAVVQSVLVAPGGIAAFVLEPDRAVEASPARDAMTGDERSTALAQRQLRHERRQQWRPALQAR